jgi:hypothetical protein
MNSFKWPVLFSLPLSENSASLSVCGDGGKPDILSRVYGSVTNNNGFWIGWLVLLTASFIIIRNHKQLQELAISLQPNPSFLAAEDSLHSRSLSFSDTLQLNYVVIASRQGPRTENTDLLLLRACLLGFSSDRYTASPLTLWLLPSNDLGANHIESSAPVLLAACFFERVYLARGFLAP